MHQNELFKEKYRVESARLKGWDYSSAGWYFITICTHSMECLFGEISGSDIRLNQIGGVVRTEWEKSFEIRKELKCDTYVIMPNHVHGLINIMNENPVADGDRVETHGRASLRPEKQMPYRAPKSISSFVAGFKSVATKRINELRNTPGQPVWQTRFYDRIIRDDNELNYVRRYIDENPRKWNLKQDEK